MHSFDDLFDYVFQHDVTIVYGNLGRKPDVLSDYLEKRFPTLEIVVVSPYYHVPSSLHLHANPDAPLQADLLVYVEPVPRTLILKPRRVGRTVAFTSHLLVAEMGIVPHIAYFEISNLAEEMRLSQALLRIQDSPVQAREADILKRQIDFPVVKTIGTNSPRVDVDLVPGRPPRPLLDKTYLIVDLTHVSRPVEQLLYLWDAFDYMKDRLDYVERWFVCFPENQIKRFEAFVQECVDKFFCVSFKGGNVTEQSDLLSLMPVYRSGVLLRDVHLETKEFFGKRYVVPRSLKEAFYTYVRYNVKPFGRYAYVVDGDEYDFN